jgi:hypothetical protein
MRRVNRWRAPQWVQWWMLLATKAGGGWLWGAVGAALLCSSDALRFRALEAAACAVAIGIVVFHKIKRRVCRPRPRDFEPHCWACIATKDKLSFPSGHTTTAFPVTLSIGSFYPEIMLALLILASQRRRLARDFGHAFLKRCSCRRRNGRAARLYRFSFRGLSCAGHMSRAASARSLQERESRPGKTRFPQSEHKI